MIPNVIWMDGEGIECGRTNSWGMFYPTEPGKEGEVNEGFMLHGMLPFLDWKHEVRNHGINEAASILMSYVQFVKSSISQESASALAVL